MRKLVLWSCSWSCCVVSEPLENVSGRKLLRKLWILGQETKGNFEHSWWGKTVQSISLIIYPPVNIQKDVANPPWKYSRNHFPFVRVSPWVFHGFPHFLCVYPRASPPIPAEISRPPWHCLVWPKQWGMAPEGGTAPQRLTKQFVAFLPPSRRKLKGYT